MADDGLHFYGFVNTTESGVRRSDEVGVPAAEAVTAGLAVAPVTVPGTPGPLGLLGLLPDLVAYSAALARFFGVRAGAVLGADGAVTGFDNAGPLNDYAAWCRDRGAPVILPPGDYFTSQKISFWTDVQAVGVRLIMRHAADAIAVSIEPLSADVSTIPLSEVQGWTGWRRRARRLGGLSGRRGQYIAIDTADQLQLLRTSGGNIRFGEGFRVSDDSDLLAHTLFGTANNAAWTGGVFVAKKIRQQIEIKGLKVVFARPTGTPAGAVNCGVNNARPSVRFIGCEVENLSGFEVAQGFVDDSVCDVSHEDGFVKGLTVVATNYGWNSSLCAGLTYTRCREEFCRRGIDAHKSKHIDIIACELPDGWGTHYGWWMRSIGGTFGASSASSPNVFSLSGGGFSVSKAQIVLTKAADTVMRVRSDLFEGGDAIELSDSNIVIDCDTAGPTLLGIQGPSQGFDFGRAIEVPRLLKCTGNTIEVRGANTILRMVQWLLPWTSAQFPQGVLIDSRWQVDGNNVLFPDGGPVLPGNVLRIEFQAHKPATAVGDGVTVAVGDLPVVSLQTNTPSAGQTAAARFSGRFERIAGLAFFSWAYGSYARVAFEADSLVQGKISASTNTAVGGEDIRLYDSTQASAAFSGDVTSAKVTVAGASTSLSNLLQFAPRNSGGLFSFLNGPAVGLFQGGTWTSIANYSQLQGAAATPPVQRYNVDGQTRWDQGPLGNDPSQWIFNAFGQNGAYLGTPIRALAASGPTKSGPPQLSLVAADHGSRAHVRNGVYGDYYSLVGQQPTSALTNAISTQSGSATVTVAWAGHGLGVGDQVQIAGASAVGGVTLSGWYTVATVPSADAFTVAASGPATGTATGGGAITIRPSWSGSATTLTAISRESAPGIQAGRNQHLILSPEGPVQPGYSGLNNWEVLVTPPGDVTGSYNNREVNVVNRGPDRGWFPYLNTADSPTTGDLIIGETDLFDFDGKGNKGNNIFAAYGVARSGGVGASGDYVGVYHAYPVWPNALVPSSRDPKGNHGGVGNTIYGALTPVTSISTVNGSTTVTVTLQARDPLIASGGTFEIITPSTLFNGVTLVGTKTIATKISDTVFTFTASSPATATGSGASDAVIHLGARRPYAPALYAGGFLYGLDMSGMTTASGEAVRMRAGQGISWLSSAGSILGSLTTRADGALIFSNSNGVANPVVGGSWTTYTPTYTTTGGSGITTTANDAAAEVVGKTIRLRFTVTVSQTGSAPTGLTVSLPPGLVLKGAQSGSAANLTSGYGISLFANGGSALTVSDRGAALFSGSSAVISGSFTGELQ